MFAAIFQIVVCIVAITLMQLDTVGTQEVGEIFEPPSQIPYNFPPTDLGVVTQRTVTEAPKDTPPAETVPEAPKDTPPAETVTEAPKDTPPAETVTEAPKDTPPAETTPEETFNEEEKEPDTVEFDPKLFFDLSDDLLSSVVTLGQEEDPFSTNETIQEKVVRQQESIKGGRYGSGDDIFGDVQDPDKVLSDSAKGIFENLFSP
eukprot:TRINITY_DN3894_c1_g3_i1.p3 TRINITY_DN3894_c1_g3~~TRINITY_DN3894_c1_g3_i1.p3  ORF type:complete len:204 (-),score=41.87 TRINITY_DN3894_c1_g3_i1:422-1033(-)